MYSTWEACSRLNVVQSTFRWNSWFGLRPLRFGHGPVFWESDDVDALAQDLVGRTRRGSTKRKIEAATLDRVQLVAQNDARWKRPK